MASNPTTRDENEGRIGAPTLDYPYGKALDSSDGLLPNGTPLRAVTINDLWGFFQAVLKESNILPSGTSETAQVSQILEGLKHLTRTGRKNLLINPLFNVNDYRIVSETPAAAVNNKYQINQWVTDITGSTGTINLGSDLIDGKIRTTLKVKVTGAGTNTTGLLGLTQRTVTHDLPSNTKITFSAWVRGSGVISLYQGGIGETTADSPVTYNADGQWKKMQWTIDTTGTSSREDYIRYSFLHRASVSNPLVVNSFVEISEPQVEPGTQATEIEWRRREEDEWFCRKFRQVIWGVGTGLSTGLIGEINYNGYPVIQASFSPQMNSIPNVTESGTELESGNSNYSLNNVSIFRAGPGSARISFNRVTSSSSNYRKPAEVFLMHDSYIAFEALL